MPIVTETLALPDGTAPRRANVHVRLVVPGYTDDDRTILSSRTLTADEDGVWEADLTANADITPANTYYEVTRLNSTVTIVVPDGAGPYQLQDLLVDDPADLDESALAVHIAQEGDPLGHLPLIADGDAGKVPTVNEDEDGYELAIPEVAAHPDVATHSAAGLATDAEVAAAVAAEAATRAAADTAEAAARAAADTAHAAAADPHPGYLTAVEGNAAYDAAGAAAAATSAHEGASNPHPTYLTQAEGDAAYDPTGAAADAVGDHEGAANPHPGYLTPAEGDAAYEASGAVAAHAAAGDPHPTYLTQAEGDALYEDDGAVVAHAAAGDPHPAYRLESDSPVDPAAGTAGLRTLGTSGTSAAAGNDSRLSDQRTPTDSSVTVAKLAAAAAARILPDPSALADNKIVKVTSGAWVAGDMTTSVRVEDEGGSVVAAANALNFAGAGVTVTDAGSNEALVTIPGGGGGVLAVNEYSASSNYTTTSSSFVDLDATNHKVTFVAPASGNVLVMLNGFVEPGTSTTVSFNLREGAADVAGTARGVAYSFGGQVPRVIAVIPVSGLTPGNSYTYKWGWARTFGSGGPTFYNKTSENNQASMVVFAR